MPITVYFDLDETLIDYTTPFVELFQRTLPTDASNFTAIGFCISICDLFIQCSPLDT